MSHPPAVTTSDKSFFRRTLRGKNIAIIAVFIAGGLGVSQLPVGVASSDHAEHDESKHDERVTEDRHSAVPTVDVVKVAAGGLSREIVQTGTIEAYENAVLVARVSGYLKTIHVNIGDHVAAGQVIAQIDAPELVTDVERQKAILEQADSRELQAQAKIHAVQADKAAAAGAVRRAEADLLRHQAERTFREKELDRFQKLVDSRAIEQKLFDEKQHRWEAAKAGEDFAQASLEIAEAELLAIDSQIKQAEADLVVAQADARVAAADLARAELMKGFLDIVAPFDGTITERNCDCGTFVQSASSTKNRPLFRLARTDQMRLVINIANSNVPFVKNGVSAQVEIDSLGGEQFAGTISRISYRQDPKTRTMRAEIDLPNPDGKLIGGMYGAVTLKTPAPTDAVLIPKHCLVGRTNNGRGQVCIVEDGVCHLRKVGLGHQDDEHVEILWNLSPDEFVIMANSESGVCDFNEGCQVEIANVHEMSRSSADDVQLSLSSSE